MLIRPMRFFCILSLLFLSSSAFGTMKLVSYPTHFYTYDSTDLANVKIKAGRTANSGSCVNGGTSPCDSCAQLNAIDNGGASVICNTNEIYSSLNFPVVFKSDTATLFTGSGTVKAVINSTTQVTLTSYSGTMAANEEITANMAWSNICLAASGDSSCSTSFNATLLVGINTDGSNTLTESVRFTIAYRYVSQSPYQTWLCGSSMNAWEGFCDFYVYPGDKKVYIDPGLNGSSDFATGNMNSTSVPSSADPSLIKYKSLRLYYLSGTSPITYAGYGASFNPHVAYQDLLLDTANSKLTKDKITGLENNQQYLFVSANVDEAGNVTHFSQISSLSDATTAPYGNSQSAIPEAVYGLLESNKCFIATAAFESDMAPEVQIFRDFRDAFLVANPVGHYLMSIYYKYSPVAAEFIASNSVLKASARWALIPVLLIVKLSLRIGMFPAFLISLVLTILASFTFRMLLAKYRGRKRLS